MQTIELRQFTCQKCDYPIGAPMAGRTLHGCRCPSCKQRYALREEITPVHPFPLLNLFGYVFWGTVGLLAATASLALFYLLAAVLAAYGPL